MFSYQRFQSCAQSACGGVGARSRAGSVAAACIACGMRIAASARIARSTRRPNGKPAAIVRTMLMAPTSTSSPSTKGNRQSSGRPS